MTVSVSQATLTVMVIPDSSLTDIQVSQCFIEVLADAPPPGRLHLQGVKLSHAIYDDQDVYIDRGDRSAYDMHLNEDLHASDIEQGPLTRHLPIPTTEGFIPIWNGTGWEGLDNTFLALTDVPDTYAGNADMIPVVNQGETGLTFEPKPDPRLVLYDTIAGTLSTGSGALRFVNEHLSHRRIVKVSISVGTAPATQPIIIDVNVEGTTIFTTQSNRPQIAATENYGETETIENDIWRVGEYLTWDIDQIGSGTVGSDIVIHIVHEPTEFLPWIELRSNPLTLTGNPITVVVEASIVSLAVGTLSLTENAVTIDANATIPLAVGGLGLAQNAITVSLG